MNKIVYYSIRSKIVLIRYNNVKEIWFPIDLIGTVDRDHYISVLTYE